MVNSMILNSDVPENLWEGALISASIILKRVPLKYTNKTPYELWKNKKPNLNFLKVWRCLAKVKIPEIKRNKIRPKTVDAFFVGYATNSNANRFLVINSEISEI